MKFYGIPTRGRTPQLVAFIPADGKMRVIKGDFGWGKDVRAGALAKAILTVYLGNETEATKLHTRFLWRVIRGLPEDKSWELTGEQIEEVVKDILGSEADLSRIRSTIASEVRPVFDERGPGLSKIENKG